MIDGTLLAITAINVEKSLGGMPILKGVNLRVAYGEIVAIIGANGSGKSLLLRILSGLAYPDKGQVVVGGHLVRPGVSGSFADIGVIIESPGFLPYLSGIDNLRLLANLKRRIADHEIQAIMYEVGLEPKDRRPVKTYSLGMRQRLGIAQALMERPSILLLDEPTNGLDPEFTEKFLSMLVALRSKKVAIVLTSHEMQEIMGLADRVLIMRSGVLTQLEKP